MFIKHLLKKSYKVLNNDKSDRYDKFKLRNKHNKNVKNNFQFKKMKSSFVISMMMLLDVVDGHGIFLVCWSLCSKFFFHLWIMTLLVVHWSSKA